MSYILNITHNMGYDNFIQLLINVGYFRVYDTYNVLYNIRDMYYTTILIS